jgi:hypothetical protein
METSKTAREPMKTGGTTEHDDKDTAKISSYGTASTPAKQGNQGTSDRGASKAPDELSDVVSESGLRAGIERGEQVVEQVKQTVADAYDKTSKGLNEGYKRAVDYGRAHPDRMSLLIFGAGVGAGLLLAGRFGTRNNRTRRIVTPVMGALSEIAAELFR